jgi:hypothetical protein
MPLMTVCPLPPREPVRQLYNVLLQRTVAVERSKVGLQPHLGVPMVAAAYSVDGGRIAAIGLWDLPLAASAAAAMGMLPPTTVGEVLSAGTLDDELMELFHEIANVTARLLNSSGTPHVVLRTIEQLPAPLPRDANALLTNPVTRLDYSVDVEGFGAGLMSLMAW